MFTYYSHPTERYLHAIGVCRIFECKTDVSVRAYRLGWDVKTFKKARCRVRVRAYKDKSLGTVRSYRVKLNAINVPWDFNDGKILYFKSLADAEKYAEGFKCPASWTPPRADYN